MIDTNSIAQAAQTIEAAKTQIDWAAVTGLALWIRADVFKCAEWIISHGGIGMIAKKLLWNPSSTLGPEPFPPK